MMTDQNPIRKPNGYGVDLRLPWLVAAALMTFTSRVLAESPLDGFNDDPSDRLRFAVDPFEEPIGYLMVEGNSKEMILRRFGEPEDVDELIKQTRFPGETYTIFTFRYSDATFVVGKWPDRDWSWIESIEINGNSQELKHGIRIGFSREQVRAIFSSLTELYSPEGKLLGTSAHIAESPADVGKDGSTLNEVGASYGIVFEFDENDEVIKISIGSSSSH